MFYINKATLLTNIMIENFFVISTSDIPATDEEISLLLGLLLTICLNKAHSIFPLLQAIHFYMMVSNPYEVYQENIRNIKSGILQSIKGKCAYSLLALQQDLMALRSTSIRKNIVCSGSVHSFAGK